MPAWVNTAEEEKAFKKAKGIVAEQRDKPESDFSDRDWGLVSHIAKNIIKSSVLSAASGNGLIYRLAKVDHLLKVRASKASIDKELPESTRSVVESLKKVMSLGGQSIAKLRKAQSAELDVEKAEELANELSAVAEKLQEMLLGI